MSDSRAVINRAWIAAHIPHQGSMCLIERVECWDEQSIECTTSTHLRDDNPLRANNSLGIANAIEFAAQAMAIHGALLLDEDEKPKAGFLTSVRDVQWQRSRFDDIAGELKICAQRISGTDVTVLYSFEITCDAQCLITGRASVVLNAAELK